MAELLNDLNNFGSRRFRGGDTFSNDIPASEQLRTVPSLQTGITTDGGAYVINPSTNIQIPVSSDITYQNTINYSPQFIFTVSSREPNCQILINGDNTFQSTPSNITIDVSDVIKRNNSYTITVFKDGFITKEKYVVDTVFANKYYRNDTYLRDLTPVDNAFYQFDNFGNPITYYNNNVRYYNGPVYTTDPIYTFRIKKYENDIEVPFEYDVTSQIKELNFEQFEKIEQVVIDDRFKLSINLIGVDSSANLIINDTDKVELKSGINELLYPSGTKISISSSDIQTNRISSIIVVGGGETKTIEAQNNLESVKTNFTIIDNVAVEVKSNTVFIRELSLPTISFTDFDSLKPYNINTNAGYPIGITKSGNVTNVKVYVNGEVYDFGNPFSLGVTNSAILILSSKAFTRIGAYKIIIVASNNDGDGQPIEFILNVVDEVYVGTPDIRNIVYPATLKGPDFVGTNVDFEISWESINTDYITISKLDGSSFIKAQQSGTVSLNIQKLLELDGTQKVENDKLISITLKLVPYNTSGKEIVEGKAELITINFEKGGLTIPKAMAINRIADGFMAQLDDSVFTDETSKYLTHFLHLGDGDNKIITTWVGDRDSLILKLYEPLPTSVQPNQQVWISKIQSTPIVETITINGFDEQVCIPLKGPNFSIEPDNGIGFSVYEELIASGSETSDAIANRYLSSIGVDTNRLNIQYSDGTNYLFENFVHFGSAEERIKNFYYKIELLETLNSKYEQLTDNSQSQIGISQTNEAKKTLNSINQILINFDGFERWLYTSTDDLAYPKTLVGDSYVLKSITDNDVISWYESAQYNSALYDKDNINYLANNIPSFITDDVDNAEFLLFLDMIGTHYDILWSYINALNRIKNIEQKADNGIPDDLIWHLLKSLGWEGKKAFNSQFLWEYAFGTNKDGTQKYGMSLETANNEVWRRIINNLPYLLKHKGTGRAMKAIMACYGVPQSLLTIMEFGGPQDPTKGGSTNFTFDDRTAAFYLKDDSNIKVPWKEVNGSVPAAIEFNFKPTTLPSNQYTLISSSQWTLDLVRTTGSFGKLELNFGGDVSDSSYILSGSGVGYPYFDVTIEYVYGPDLVTGSLEFPISTEYYSNVCINRTDYAGNGSLYEVWLGTSNGDRIITSVSMSIFTEDTQWTSGSSLQIGGNGFDGNIDEFRLWRVPLQRSKFNNHTLQPDSIVGNSYTASTSDLLFRLDFEYPKDRIIDPYIKNVAINQTYGEQYASASNMYSAPSYPYQYTPYERTVTATVPSLGFNVSNKIRFEEQTLVTNLSHKTRATQKSFDRAPIDSSRLGLFFSPIKELNMDIVKAFGDFNIDNYIGDPSDDYKDSYKELENLRSYYFERLDRNINEYIQLVKYIDKSLFDVLADLAPARAKVSKGLLIEPHYLERSKTRWDKPKAEQNNYHTSINTNEDINIQSSYNVYNSELDAENTTTLIGDLNNYDTTIDVGNKTTLDGNYPTYDSMINIGDETVLEATAPFYDAQITVPNGAALSGEADAYNFQIIGMEKDSISNLGFGLYGIRGVGVYKKYDIFGNYTQSRQNIYLVKEQYSKKVSTQVAGYPTIGSQPGDQVKYEDVVVPYTKYRVSLMPFSGSVMVGNEIVSVTPLNGYLPSHYRYTNNLGEGMIRSFWKGSQQTAATTPDGLSPVETFTTNPNILRVAKTGRGSGEPILEVD